MMGRVEAATRAYPYFDNDKTPPELMDMMRRSLSAADNIMFSEDSINNALRAAKESMYSHPEVRLSSANLEIITKAIIDELRRVR